MAKGKAALKSREPSSGSDDVDDSNEEQDKKEIHTIPLIIDNLKSQRQIIKKDSSKRKHRESSSNSEVEYPNKKTKQVIENIPGKLNKKIKKQRKEEVSSDNDSSREENVNSRSVNNVDKISPDKVRIKPKKHDKKKVLDTRDFLKDIKEIDESDGATSNKLIKKNDFKQKSVLNIKKEVISDDADSNSESDTNGKNSASVTNTLNEITIKREVETNSSSNSEGEASSVHESKLKNSQTESPSVTILQDIRFTPKSKKSPKDRLMEMYPGLKPIDITAKLELLDSEEIHLFRIPKNVDPKLLKNVEIDLENECKIDLGEKYIITPTIKTPDPTLVIHTNSGVLEFKNNIKMEKYIKSKTEPHITIPERKSVPLPENLKKRHPLFGSDFQQKIRLSEHVEKKLDEAIANLLKRERKSKKKKDKKNKQENEEEKSNQEIFNLFNAHSFLTSHDKIKKENSDDSAFGSSCSTDKPRSKKKTKEHALDKNVELEVEVPVEKEKRKEKKKKDKHSHDHDRPDAMVIKQENYDIDTIKFEEDVATPSKKKKKKSSVVNSTLMSDILRTPSFNLEVSTIVSEPSTSVKKSKKSKKDKTPLDEGSIKKEKLISELLNDVTMEIHVSKKIKSEF